MIRTFEAYELRIRDRRGESSALIEGHEIVVDTMENDRGCRDLLQQINDIDLIDRHSQFHRVLTGRGYPLKIDERINLFSCRTGEEERAKRMHEYGLLVFPAAP